MENAHGARRDFFLASTLFLFLELAFIRWLPAQVLFLTFFTNTVLLASFLGLSLGCMAARARRNHLALTPPLLAVCLAAGSSMESIRLALQDVIDVGGNKASPQMVFFGTEVRVGDIAAFVVPMEAVAGLFFVLVALTMVGVGQELGRRFAAVVDPVRAYSINIGGSLVGILLFQILATNLSPVWWFSLASAVLIYFLVRQAAWPWWSIGCCAAIPVLLLVPELLNIGVIRQRFPVEIWSPYYRINYSSTNKTIVVNLLGHQQMVSRGDPFPAYVLPYLFNRDSGQVPFHDILIIGAGSGNDVSRALQWAAADARIDAVEIDPVIQRLGIRDHPDHPYQDPRVTRHLGDGRNFLRSTTRKYDLVIFALIDSLVLHSSMSNIRLESYLFTREAMADVRRCLKPDGLFAMYNYFRQGWIVARLVKTVESAFGAPALTLTLPHQPRIAASSKADAFTLLLAGGRADAITHAFRTYGAYRLATGLSPSPAATPNGFHIPATSDQMSFAPADVEIPAGLRIAEDVWPFLYLRNPMIPSVSWRGLALIALLSVVLLRIFGWRPVQGAAGRLNGSLFLLGAGFMLLETKAVVHLALVFGSTWIVNTVVFATIMMMILAANLWVSRRKSGSLLPYTLALLAALAVNIVIPLDSFLGLPLAVQSLAAAALVLSPVLFSGVLFATLITRSPAPEQAMAYNAAGAMAGGALETVSLLIGFQYLLVLAMVIYAAAWTCAAFDSTARDENALGFAEPGS
jgi:spermidine synthase